MEFSTGDLTAREMLYMLRAAGNNEMHDRFDAMFRLLASRGRTSYETVLDMAMPVIEQAVKEMTAATSDLVNAATNRERIRRMFYESAQAASDQS